MLVQEILDLKQASDKARLRSWDVFKSLYTIDSSSTELNFIGQQLDDEGAVIVSDTIDVFSSLQTLNLSENVVAAKGMEALSSNGCIHTCVCFTSVYLCMGVCACICVRDHVFARQMSLYMPLMNHLSDYVCICSCTPWLCRYEQYPCRARRR